MLEFITIAGPIVLAIAILVVVWFTLKSIELAAKEKDTHKLVAECVTLLAICILLT